ncbi:MAG: hypothetical protein RR654_00860 [Oscillospiraceae bacterium]
MKGTNKNIIEITDTDNEFIERVIVFMKPNCGKITIANRLLEANKYVSGLVTVSRVPWFAHSRTVLCIFAAVFILAIIGIVIFI